ncbi:MAG: pyridoxamine 5'-phosphate oxidase family protein [Nitrospirota bacterium]
MFKQVRRQERAIGYEETIEVLKEGCYGVLSMQGDEGYPYGVPLNYVYEDDHIYFHGNPEGEKITLLRRNNAVSFCVVSEAYPLPDAFSTRYKSAIVFGKIREIDGEEKRKALCSLIEKYASGEDYIQKGKQYADEAFHRTAVLRLDIEHCTGKARK